MPDDFTLTLAAGKTTTVSYAVTQDDLERIVDSLEGALFVFDSNSQQVLSKLPSLSLVLEAGEEHKTWASIEKILKAGDLCTMVTGKRLGHPVRSLRTPFARNYAKAEYSDMPDAQLEQLGVGALRKAVKDGDSENGCFLAGQVASSVNKVEKAADIVRSVIEEAEPVLKGAAKWIR